MATDAIYDFVVVGSGAGGGPLAANLALGGFRVLVLEAGKATASLSYSVPAFQGLVTEDEDYRWDYFVRHYPDQAQQQRDPKFVPAKDGILYPRAGTLGGCTAHNAMLTVYPSNSDWDRIADLTGDASWSATSMRKYYERLEQCAYLGAKEIALSKHGSSGWLTTEWPDTNPSPRDWQAQATIQQATALSGFAPINPNLDPNAWVVAEERREGINQPPLATRRHARNGPREYLLEVAQQFPERLTIQTETFVTRVLFDDDGETAVGVEVLEGAHLYRADPNSDLQCSITAPTRREIRVRREVIVAAGTFNTPQLLMLSGVGPRAELEALGVPVIKDLPGVGANLQDRYEVGVVYQMQRDWSTSALSTFSDNPERNPALAQWLSSRTGIYTSSGTAVAYLARSNPELLDPDLYLFAFTSRFQGYFPQWFSTFEGIKDQFTWAILKAHTLNNAGTVRLGSSDPLDTPSIDFKYFDPAADPDESDLQAMVWAVKFIRQIMTGSPYVVEELLPGPAIQTDAEIAQWVRDQAWGHHASCTCPIGADDDPDAVLDGDFRVRGTKNLRVVDASVFPRIPGYFIVLPIYMISEKASDVILAQARASG